MNHSKDCQWKKTTSTECEYRETHEYCPHAEHACTCVSATAPVETNTGMREYHKINSLYKRNPDTGEFYVGEWSCPEFQFLQNNIWVFTEKVDGTNIRVYYDGKTVKFGGRTDKAQIPARLVERLVELFPVDKFAGFTPETCLYGEGYGARIQGGGGNYKADGNDFVLFDVRVGAWWLERSSVESVAQQLGIGVVPILGEGTLHDGIEMCKKGFHSTWGPFEAEGLVVRPKVELRARSGARIITKIKISDFR